MRRREFITLLGGAVTWPLAAHAQKPDRNGSELGWKDGQNIRIDYRWGGADAERIQVLAKELVDQQPDILVGRSTPSAKGLLKQTRGDRITPMPAFGT